MRSDRDTMARRSAALLVAAVACVAFSRPALAQRPDAELAGITAVGVRVEPLGPAAATCGFTKQALEQSLSKMLAGGGLKVVPGDGEPTYVDLRVETLNVQPGVCVSRFDTTLFTATTARLSYQSQPVPVRVSLLHEAGLSGGGAAAHAASVLRLVGQQVDGFIARIKAASR